jgi:hypothetical protein
MRRLHRPRSRRGREIERTRTAAALEFDRPERERGVSDDADERLALLRIEVATADVLPVHHDAKKCCSRNAAVRPA